jgi:hypothetical protein
LKIVFVFEKTLLKLNLRLRGEEIENFQVNFRQWSGVRTQAIVDKAAAVAATFI